MVWRPEHTPVRILCVEDDDSHLDLFRAYLGKLPFSVEVLAARGTEEARARVAADAVDAVIVDYQLPDGSGLDLIEQLAAEEGPPVIAVSGVGSEKIAVGAMKRGAADYLKKDGDLRNELPRAVHEALERKGRRQARRRVSRELEVLAFTDPLTGLRNRRYFEDAFEREYSSAKRYGNPLSLLVLDLDHLKRVNDSYGHPAGDRVLVEASNRIREIVRVSDLVARYGGEELVVLLPCTGLEGAEILGNRILRGISSEGFVLPAVTLSVTISGGLATFTGGPVFGSAQQLFFAADAALYRAKEEGRNRLVLAPRDVPEDGAPPRRPSRPWALPAS